MPMATMIVMNRCHVSTTLPMSMPCLSAKNSGSGEIEVSSQIVVARPMKKNMSPMVTTSCTTSRACTSLRMMNRSMVAPSSGAAIRITKISANGAGHPWLIRTSQ